jgi:hypothetical protein
MSFETFKSQAFSTSVPPIFIPSGSLPDDVHVTAGCAHLSANCGVRTVPVAAAPRTTSTGRLMPAICTSDLSIAMGAKETGCRGWQTISREAVSASRDVDPSETAVQTVAVELKGIRVRPVR